MDAEKRDYTANAGMVNSFSAFCDSLNSKKLFECALLE